MKHEAGNHRSVRQPSTTLSRGALVRRGLAMFAATAMLAPLAQAAAPIVDGLLGSDYGSPLATQTNNTGFGDNTDPSGASNSGSELDAAYATVQNGTLYLFFAGNLQTNFNHLNVFIADGRAGQNVLNAGGATGAMNGSTFSPGFNATYSLDINGGGSPLAEYVNQNNLTANNGPSSYLGSFTPNDGSPHNLGGGVVMSLNNTNVAGVSGNTAVPANAADANAVNTGFEIAIPLSALDNPRGPIKVLADINGGGNSYLSNQFLPGLPTQAGNVGGGGTYSVAGQSGQFNFGATAGQFFSVAAPVGSTTNGNWTSTSGGTWTSGANWFNGVIPGNAGDSAAFAAGNTALSSVTLDGTQTVGQLIFNSPVPYSVDPGINNGNLVIDDTNDPDGNFATIIVNQGNNLVTAPVTLANGVTIDTAPPTVLTISGNIGGSGGLTKIGSGKLVLSGTNTYTGNTTTLAGTLELDTASAVPAGGSIFLGDVTTDYVPTILTIGDGGLTISNPITTDRDDAGSDTQRIITGTYGTGTSTLGGPLTLNGGVILSAQTSATLAVSGPISDGTDTANTAKHDVLINSNGTDGTIVLSNANTYSGITAVDAGTLILENNTAASANTIYIGNGGAANANVNATLLADTVGMNIANSITTNQADTGTGVGTGTRTIGATNTTGTVTYSGAIELNGGAVLSAATGGTVAFTGVISNGTGGGNFSHAVTIPGPGTVELSAANTYTGDTTVNGGALTVDSTGSLASGNVTVANGSTLNLNGTLTATPNVTVGETTDSAGGSVHVGANPATGILARSWGALTINTGGSVNLADAASHANRTVLVVNGALSNSGTLDLGGNDLLVKNGNLSVITSQLASGFNHGSGYWNGSGIQSSTAANDSSYLTTLGVVQATGAGTFDGQTVAAGDVEVKYTYYGDADLSGQVDGTDYSLIDHAFTADQANPGSVSGWQNGDFNYDGKIDGSDYSLIDNAFNMQGTHGLASPMNMIATNTSEIASAGISPASPVPEPGTLSVLVIGAMGLLSRRRRK